MAQLKSTTVTGDLSVSGTITGSIAALSGLTASIAELNHCDGVTSNIQTQLNGKAPSSHEHDYIKYRDTRDVNVAPKDMPQGISVHLKTNGTDSLTDGGTYHPSIMIRDWSDYSGGPFGQLSITANNNLWFRSSSSETGWNSWKKVSLDGHTHSYAASSHTHSSLTDRTYGTATYLNYGASAVTSASYLAAWNGYELRAIAPATVRSIIGAQASGSYAASSHSHSLSSLGLKFTTIVANGSAATSASWTNNAYDFFIGCVRPASSNTPACFSMAANHCADIQVTDEVQCTVWTTTGTGMTRKSGSGTIFGLWGVNVV